MLLSKRLPRPAVSAAGTHMCCCRHWQQQPLSKNRGKEMDIPKPKLVDAGSPPVNENATQELVQPQRRRLPDERRAITHHFAIGGHEGYVTVGLYEDDKVGELFIKMSKEGSTVSGLMDSFATAVS